MKKSWSAAVAAAVLITGGGALHAMDYRIGFQASGGITPLSYRYTDPTDEQKADAHTLEVNGQPASAGTGAFVLGDQQPAEYEKGLAFWSNAGELKYLSAMFQQTSNSNAFSFGARFQIKAKEYNTVDGNGWSAWLDWKQLELKVGTVGGLGWSGYVRTGGMGLATTAALYAWEIGDKGVPNIKSSGDGNARMGDETNYNIFGYLTCYVSSDVNCYIDNTKAFGLKWVQKVNGNDTLDLRLVHMFTGKNLADGGTTMYSTAHYGSGNSWNIRWPLAWNVQANYKASAWTASTTFKYEPLHLKDDGDWREFPDMYNWSWHLGFDTSLIPRWSFSAGYSLVGEMFGVDDDVAYTNNGTSYTETYDKSWLGQLFEIALGTRIGDWSVSFNNKLAFITLSEYNKAVSNASHFGWKPYIGEYVSVNLSKRINGLLTSYFGLGFDDANLNSYTDGKGEATIWFKPSVDISPSRGVVINVGLNCSLTNFSDEAKGWWSHYADAASSTFHGVYYTYPHTLNVSIPISLRVGI